MFWPKVLGITIFTFLFFFKVPIPILLFIKIIEQKPATIASSSYSLGESDVCNQSLIFKLIHEKLYPSLSPTPNPNNPVPVLSTMQIPIPFQIEIPVADQIPTFIQIPTLVPAPVPVSIQTPVPIPVQIAVPVPVQISI